MEASIPTPPTTPPKGNATERLAYLNLVEPTLKTPDIELFFKNSEKKEYIKAFKMDYIFMTQNK
ncbi:hypothetical protein [Helicobacter felistomachi]|uniref:hypothetical protein n=1 Tax=Helicobacter felistomachi TaxID=3040201 RepID=UPI0025745502|nr:hypothetical protein [Helicobacter sp. NHP21005]